MSKCDIALSHLCKQLGENYCIRTIDLERCIYRDFGNGFNVEISRMHTTRADRQATIYLWFGENSPDCLIVETVRDVPREKIAAVVDDLFAYSEQLIRDGYDNRNALFRLKHPELATNNTY